MAWEGRAVVPKGHVWVEGDNWRKTVDSNNYGPISMSLVQGRAIAVLNPSKFWTKPWEGFKSRTKVASTPGGMRDWTEGLPIELAEIAGSHVPP